jgi:hypothetical protein
MTRIDTHWPKAFRGALVAIVCVTPGCRSASGYRPGFLLAEPLTQRGAPPGAAAARRLGCLDIRMALACNAAVSPEFPLVAFTLGNRCDVAIPVDFTRIRVTGRLAGANVGSPEETANGVVALSVYDPIHEIHPAVLGSRAMAREVLEYDASPREATRQIAQVCVDLDGLTPAGARRESPQAMTNGGEVGAAICLTRPVDACTRS